MRTARSLALLSVLAACRAEPPPPPPAAAAPAPVAAPAATPPAPPARSAPRAALPGEPDWGEPDMPKIQKLFKQRFAEVKRCYEAELQSDPSAGGKLTLRFTIAETGALQDVAVAKTTFRSREVPACVVEVVRRWRTPFRPAEPVEVEYPFRFSPR
jgi:TonB family protein